MEGMETHVGRDTTDDDLLLPSCLDGLPEVGVVPCIHFSLALDVRCVGVHRYDLLGQGAVLSCNPKPNNRVSVLRSFP